jgi:hypothetical protein
MRVKHLGIGIPDTTEEIVAHNRIALESLNPFLSSVCNKMAVEKPIYLSATEIFCIKTNRHVHNLHIC